MSDHRTDPNAKRRKTPIVNANEQAMHTQMNSIPRKADPDWAMGLKQLYNSVVEEPLPDAFTDLLARLDKNEPR